MEEIFNQRKTLSSEILRKFGSISKLSRNRQIILLFHKFLWKIKREDCWGPAGSRGTLRMNGVGEREARRTGLDRAKSAREREKKRSDQEYAAESGSCFIFHHSLYTLSWQISKGQISIQAQFNITSACPSQNQVCSVYFLFMRVFSHRFFVHYLLALRLAEDRKLAVSWYSRLQHNRNTILLT